MEQVFLSIVESIFALFQVQIKIMLRDTVELLQPAFGETPKALYSVYVVRAVSKLIPAVIDAKMLRITDIDQPVVPTPFVRVDDRIGVYSAPYNGLKGAFLAVRDDLRVNAPVPLEDPEDYRLARSSASALAPDTACPEIALVDFDHATERRSPFAFFRYPVSDFAKQQGHRQTTQTGQLGRLARRQIECKITHDLTHFSFINFGTPVIPV